MLVRDLMVRSVDGCPMDGRLRDALGLMRSHHRRCLPVVEDGLLVGVITDRDLEDAVAKRPDALDALAVREVMTTNVATCRATDPIVASLRLMFRRHLRHLPVVSAEGDVEGMLSLADAAMHRERMATDAMAMDALELAVSANNCARRASELLTRETA